MANRLIPDMDKDAFGSKSPELAECPRGMLAQVARSIAIKEPVVFLRWFIHEQAFEIAYLIKGARFSAPNLAAPRSKPTFASGLSQEMLRMLVSSSLNLFQFSDIENDKGRF